MAAVTVLKFDSPAGAEHALARFAGFQKEHLIKLQDAAIVSWPLGKKSPRTRQIANLVAIGAMSGMFWGMLFGVIFFMPIFGMVAGAAMGALGGSFRDYGIDDDFIERVRTQITEGTSGLFLMTSDAVVDRIAERMKDLRFEILATNLSAEQEQKLRDVFAQEEPPATV